ncbi:MAG: histidine kinase [Bacteroidetes bacterium]|nr:histidine kinase [Bacteroidota bacterium]
MQNQASELALLRSQVNPHFLFNTLNNIYSLVYRKMFFDILENKKCN